VALSFDDGPDPATTPRTLALCDTLALRATFFLLGARVEAHPDLVHAIRAGGHGIAVHGHRHAHHLLHRPRWIDADLERALSALEQAGCAPRLFRPPYGQLTAATVRAARRHRLEVVLWSGWGREWADADDERVLARLSAALRPGAILLLHDSDQTARPGTAARIQRLLPRLATEIAERGLTAVSVEELLDAGGRGR
jgi:peptidoglycan/xylan/chitin deacetylase (PgdA/CDA1 family)